MRDTQNPGRYLTIDHWEDLASHQAMRERLAKEYEGLDRVCESFTEMERQIGIFDEV